MGLWPTAPRPAYGSESSATKELRLADKRLPVGACQTLMLRSFAEVGFASHGMSGLHYGDRGVMTTKRTKEQWFLDDMSPEEFEKLSGEERLRKLMQHELEGLSGEELEARVEEITKGADEFVKKLRLSRLSDEAGK